MRIAVLSTSYPRHEGDPSGHFVRTEVEALRASGCDVEVFAAQGSAFGWPGVVPKLREAPLRALPMMLELAWLRRDLRARAPWDGIVAHWLPTALLARGVRAHLTVVAHGSDVRLVASLPAPLRRALLDVLTDHANVVRVVSCELEEMLLGAASGRARERLRRKTAVVPSPISPASADVRRAIEARRRAHAAGHRDTKLAVTVGRLIPSKRVERVLERFASANDWTLVVVGDGPERARLEACAATLGVNATFVGLVDRAEALTWIGAADLLVHASAAEGLSTVLREAAALNTPVLTL